MVNGVHAKTIKEANNCHQAPSQDFVGVGLGGQTHVEMTKHCQRPNGMGSRTVLGPMVGPRAMPRLGPGGGPPEALGYFPNGLG